MASTHTKQQHTNTKLLNVSGILGAKGTFENLL